MRTQHAQRWIEVNRDELDRIIEHGMRAPLSESDAQKIKTTLHAMGGRLMPKRSTEKTSAVLAKPMSEPAVPAKDEGPPSTGHGRHGAAAFAGATRVSIPHATLQSGDACPECGKGKVYRQKDPATLVRIMGQPPLKTAIFEMERLRCNACGQIFQADEPEEAGAEKYDAAAVAMIAPSAPRSTRSRKNTPVVR
jgi:rubredoxin